MNFNKTKFMKQQFEPRTARVAVPALSVWFDNTDDEDKQCFFTVRGLTGEELARTLESSLRVKDMHTIVEAIANTDGAKDKIMDALGLGTDTPADIIKRLEQLDKCSVAPKLDLEVAKKLAQTFPIEFYTLTNKITELTGLGMDVKKSPASGQDQK